MYRKIRCTKVCKRCGHRTPGSIEARMQDDGTLWLRASRLGIHRSGQNDPGEQVVPGVEVPITCGICSAELRAAHYLAEAKRFAARAMELRERRTKSEARRRRDAR